MGKAFGSVIVLKIVPVLFLPVTVDTDLCCVGFRLSSVEQRFVRFRNGLYRLVMCCVELFDLKMDCWFVLVTISICPVLIGL